MNAKMMSEAIRNKRKKLKEGGVEKMVDTAALPQMNPTDILNMKQEAQMDDTMDLPEKSEAPSDPADARVTGSSQDVMELKKAMAKVGKILGKLSVG